MTAKPVFDGLVFKNHKNGATCFIRLEKSAAASNVYSVYENVVEIGGVAGQIVSTVKNRGKVTGDVVIFIDHDHDGRGHMRQSYFGGVKSISFAHFVRWMDRQSMSAWKEI